ncbi:MAG TPA: ABC transporter permease [Vicinamibacteria bacterium]
MEGFSRDVRHALRSLLRTPRFTALVVAVLGLGIGSATAVFSVVNAALLRPLPYPAGEELGLVEGSFLRLGMTDIGATVPEFLEYRREPGPFADTAAFRNLSVNLSGGADPERIVGARVSARLFPMLRAQPLLGRALGEDDERPGHDDVAVLGYGLWQRRFGGDPAIVGRTIVLDLKPHTVVGVMPAAFEFPHPGFRHSQRAELWLPLAFTEDQRQDDSSYSLRVLARLRPGVSTSAAGASLEALAHRLERQKPRTYRGPRGEDGGWRIRFVPLREEVVGDAGRGLIILLSAVGLLLLIACADVASLLVARASARRKTLAVRAALGASRSRLAREGLAESLVLAGLGGAAGIVFASWGRDALVSLRPHGIPRLDEAGLDGRVLAFAILASLATSLFFGVLPALLASRLAVGDSLREGGRTGTGGRFRRAHAVLVVLQHALALVLLVGAGLLVRSFLLVQRAPRGFEAGHLLTAQLPMPAARFADDVRRAAFLRDVRQRVEALPGVRAAGLVSVLPFDGSGFGGPFSVEGRPFDPSGAPPVANYRAMSAGYLEAMGIPILRGRAVADGDGPEAPPVVVINEVLARTFFSGEEPLGRRIKLGGPGAPTPWRTIVGVAGAVGDRSPARAPRPEMYVPDAQQPPATIALVVRTEAEPMALLPALRTAVRAVDPDQPLASVRTMDAVLAASVSDRRFSMLLLSAFAAMALLLAVLGLYGVATYAVNRRTPEMGVRMALGARPDHVLALVIGEGLRLAAVGMALGAAAALALARVITGNLYGVGPADPLTFVAMAATLMVAALVAVSLPARRAARLDPMAALREE